MKLVPRHRHSDVAGRKSFPLATYKKIAGEAVGRDRSGLPSEGIKNLTAIPNQEPAEL